MSREPRTAAAHAPRCLRQIFAAPLLVAMLTAVGLLSALVGDGLWDALSWLALGAVVALAAVCGLPRR